MVEAGNIGSGVRAKILETAKHFRPWRILRQDLKRQNAGKQQDSKGSVHIFSSRFPPWRTPIRSKRMHAHPWDAAWNLGLRTMMRAMNLRVAPT
jgi:hypothetical protein